MDSPARNDFDESPAHPSRSGSGRALGPRGPRLRGHTQGSEPNSPSPGGFTLPPEMSSPRDSTHSKEFIMSSPTMSLSHFDLPTSSSMAANSDSERVDSINNRDDWELELPPPRTATSATFEPSPTASKHGPTATPSPKIPQAAKNVTLKPPPKLNFEVAPITHKGLPLDAAQWTLTTDELQEIVSRAIRLSARESFIRVLPVDTVDNVLAQEAERLASLRLTTQSQYRFQMHRRTMLLQSLVSCSTATPVDPTAVANLAVQLSELTAACDRILEQLVHITDQQGQIKSMVELHWASALAIALRKLNKSYERKSMELKEAKVRIAGLEGELAEAWAEATNLAEELDRLEESSQDGEELDWGGGASIGHAQVVEVKGRAVASEGKVLRSPPPTGDPQSFANEQSSPFNDPSPADGEYNSEDSMSRNGHTSPQKNRGSRIAAAKERSRRTSDAGLRANRSVDQVRRPPPLHGMPPQRSQETIMDSPTLGPDTPRPVPESRTSMYAFSTTGASENGRSANRFSAPNDAGLSGDSYLDM